MCQLANCPLEGSANTLFAYADALTFKYITCKMAERARQEADGMGEGGARTA